MAASEHNPFTKLKSEEEFEDLCRDLLARQPHLLHPQKLKRKGSPQYGGDIAANVKGQTTTIVAQCKWYIKTDFEKGKIKEAIDLFLEHWESFWRQKKPVEFYLMVSQPKLKDNQFEEIQIQKERLFGYGIILIDWWEDDLKREISRYPDLVRRYLGIFWLDQLCPEEYTKLQTNQLPSEIGFLADLKVHDYRNTLGEDVRIIIESLREKVRCGRIDEAERQFVELREQHIRLVDPKIKAELLSFEIRLFFPVKRSIAQARMLLAEIEQTDPSFDFNYLDALITSREEDFEAALAKVPTVETVQSLNLKLNFLLNLNRTAEFFELYENNLRRFEYEIETRRLYAMALVSAARMDEAKVIIDEISSEKSEWESIKIAEALIYYYQGIPPQLILNFPLGIALPLPLSLVKMDEISNDCRRRAARLFKQILAASHLDDEQRLVFETWYLASLADDIERQNEAEEYCRELIDQNPTHPYALLWASFRGYRIDPVKVMEAFDAEEKAGGDATASTATVINKGLMHVRLCLTARQYTKAARKLSGLESSLTDPGQKDIYNYWDSQIRLARGEEEQVFKKHALKIKDLRLRQDTQINALRSLVKRTRNRKHRRRLIRFLKKVSRGIEGEKFLPDYIEVCFQSKNFKEVVDLTPRIRKLVSSIYFAEIIIQSHYFEGKLKDCLNHIENFRRFYPNGELPSFISHIKAYCLIRTGNPEQAAQEAEKLFSGGKTAANFLTLFDAQRYSGDIPGIVKATRDLGQQLYDIEPNKQLLIAQTIYRESPETAAAIWRQVKKHLAENKQLIGSAIALGFHFGLGSEVGELFEMANQVNDAAQTGISRENIDRVARNFSRQREESEKSFDLYRRGELFIHMFAEQRNLSFTQLIHHIADKNGKKENILGEFSIYTRNGNRSIDGNVLLESKSPNIYLDITSLLLLEHLSLLNKLAAVSTVTMSNQILIDLEAEIENLSDHNPENTEINRRIIEMFDNDHFKTTAFENRVTAEAKEEFVDLLAARHEIQLNLLLNSSAADSYAIMDLPLQDLRTGEPVEMPKRFTHIRDYSSLIKTMELHNLLTANEKSRFAHGPKVNLDERFAGLPINSSIYLADDILYKLAATELLEKACQFFAITVEKRIIDHIRIKLKNIDSNEKSVKWLQGLEAEIKSGLGKNFQMISEEDLAPLPTEQGKNRDGYRVDALETAVRLKSRENAFACVDDRLFSGFSTINGQIPVITAYEVLEFLKAKKAISSDEYFRKLLQLQNENFRYLPITKDELNYYLDLCSEEKLTDLGSLELSIMRRYTAACLLDGEYLQKPPFPLSPEALRPPSEFDLATGTVNFFNQYLINIWKKTESLELAESRSSFIFFNFYTGSYGIKHLLPVYAQHRNGLFHQSTDIAGLYVQGISLLNIIVTKETIVRPKAYFSWLNKLMVPRLEADQSLLEETVNWISMLLQNIITRPSPDTDEDPVERFISDNDFVRKLYQNLVALLPPILQSRLLEKDEVREWLEIPVMSAVSINEYTFAATDLFDAFRSSFNDGETTVKLLDSGEEVHMLPLKTDHGTKHIEVKKGAATILDLGESKFGFNYPTEEERYSFFRNSREVFDTFDAQFDSECRRLAATADDTERFFAFDRFTKQSIELAYREFENKINHTGTFNWREIAELPVEGLLKHYRLTDLPEQADFPQVLENISSRLIDEEGIETALRRMTRLPHMLPEVFIEKIREQSTDRQKELIENACAGWRSPLGRFHYLYLSLTILGDEHEASSKAREEAAYLFSEAGILEFAIFKKMLSLLYGLISSNLETREVEWSDPVKLLLLWAHAGKIFDLIIRVNAKNPEEHANLLDYLNGTIDFKSQNLFDFNSFLDADWLHPRFLNREVFYGLTARNFFKDVPSEILKNIDLTQQLSDLCFIREETTLYPNQQFLIDHRRRTNLTGSFLSAENLETFFWLEVEGEETEFDLTAVQESFFNILKQTSSDSANIHHWSVIEKHIDGFPLTGQAAENFVGLIAEIEIEQLWANAPETLKQILKVAVSQKSIYGSEMEQKVGEWINWLVWQLAQKYPKKIIEPKLDEIQDWVSFVAELIYRWNLVPKDAVISSRSWNDSMFELGQIWSYIPLRLEHIFIYLWMQLSTDQNQHIWKNILLARALK